MKKKHATIDFELCRPGVCSKLHGHCAALQACTHRLLEQEERDDAPVLLSQSLCVGCGHCARSCRFGAIIMD
jgi:translation initiation factor RLI1